MFFKGSRYENVGSEELTDGKGRRFLYKKTRFIPKTPPDKAHTVVEGDRLDHLANRYFQDPERFWRISDAALVMWPDDLLMEAGRRIPIPAPEG